jgi:hypothetical protein
MVSASQGVSYFNYLEAMACFKTVRHRKFKEFRHFLATCPSPQTNAFGRHTLCASAKCFRTEATSLRPLSFIFANPRGPHWVVNSLQFTDVWQRLRVTWTSHMGSWHLQLVWDIFPRLMFCWPCIIVYQYSETNVMHFLLNLLRIKGL